MYLRPFTSSLCLVVRASLCAALAAAGLAMVAVPSAGAAVSGQTEIRVVSKGKASKSLRKQGVRMRAIRPAKLSRGELALPVARLNVARRTTITHRGGLVMRRGKRRVGFRAFQVRLGDKRTVVARSGKRRITLLVIRRGRVRAQSSDSASLSGGKAVLTRKGARLIKRKLRLRRLPAGALGASGIKAARTEEEGRTQAPSTTPTSPAPRGGSDTTSPTTSRAVGTDWIASTIPDGTQSLKSWIRYILGGPPGSGVGASVTPSEGATQIAADNPSDYRLTVASASTAPDGVTTIEHDGRIRYHKPQHSIDQQIADLTMVIAADGQTGQVIADGQYQESAMLWAPGATFPYSDKHVLDLNLAGIDPKREPNGSVTWENVPATVSQEASDTGYISYDKGTPWGRFTITAPGEDVRP